MYQSCGAIMSISDDCTNATPTPNSARFTTTGYAGESRNCWNIDCFLGALAPAPGIP